MSRYLPISPLLIFITCYSKRADFLFLIDHFQVIRTYIRFIFCLLTLDYRVCLYELADDMYYTKKLQLKLFHWGVASTYNNYWHRGNTQYIFAKPMSNFCLKMSFINSKTKEALYLCPNHIYQSSMPLWSCIWEVK